MISTSLVFTLALSHITLQASAKLATDPTTQLDISVVDGNGEALPCRIHLINEQGIAQKFGGQPFWHDHFVCSGRIAAPIAPGKYNVAVERGPEYRRATQQVEVLAGVTRILNIKLERIADLRANGWFSADLHVHRPVDDIESLMQAEDLDFAPVITWWNNRNLWKDKAAPKTVERLFDGHRLHTNMAGEDEREGGALLYFGLTSPLSIATNHREFPSPMQFVTQARQRDPHVWIDIEKPFWWDVPVWLASGQMHSIGVANNHMGRSRMYLSEAWGKPRDAQRLPNPRGNGFWTQEIYYHILNSGLRLPPSAGSASGVLPNPVGYNRVYVHLDEPFTSAAWFRGLSRGRCFVTNGPLLTVTADGRDPGSTIKLQTGERRTLKLQVQLTSQDPVSQVELVVNGRISRVVQCTSELTQSHTLALPIDAPGWFLVRAIANVDNTFRFASTAPWYVEQPGAERRISRQSAQFFLDWVNERIARVTTNVADDRQRDQILIWHEKAREFWADRLKMANSD